MKNTKSIILVIISILFVTMSFAQRKNYKIKNGIGLQGGITQFDILTDNFETKSNTGFIGGMSASVDLPHKWYNVSYNIQLSQNHIDISASEVGLLTNEFVEYKMFTANISFLLHIKLISNNFTLDVGPMLQYNSELELNDETKQGYILTGYNNLLTEDIREISNFNANGAIGLSFGIRRFQFRAQYIYGFTNILGKLNDKDFNLVTNKKFEGNQSLLAFTAIITL
ncbi:hypothetical protein HNV10_02975 [Winogradskyella litoriviva]|uniref:Outer membrane protein beta-barrel domain-containing protein n=1 Tax=Winogradskyella litoriviva TaxID=1220182 RepID=A0ABX2E148_9FLAO|nr:hypothetical protein [Winogradskyella litoriviva]NRD22188.1 hypothetical protein [Winogradskyella litoriviva]